MSEVTGLKRLVLLQQSLGISLEIMLSMSATYQAVRKGRGGVQRPAAHCGTVWLLLASEVTVTVK